MKRSLSLAFTQALIGLVATSALVGLVATSALAAAPTDKAPGACERWSSQLCDAAGAESEACKRARAVAPILPEEACTAAAKDIAGTIERAKALRQVCAELATRLCRDLGDEAQTCAMIRARTPDFSVSQCQEMIDHYAEVLAEVQEIERQSAPLSPELVARQSAEDAPSFGPKDAAVVIVEYSDFQCPYCARAAANIGKLKAKYGDAIRVVFRQFPLPFHDNAQLAAEASLEAQAQGKFWELHELLFANQDKLDRASLERWAKEAGMDVAKLAKALDAGTYKARVAADVKLGEEAGVNGTPSMMLGARRIENPNDFKALTTLIDLELAAAEEKRQD